MTMKTHDQLWREMVARSWSPREWWGGRDEPDDPAPEPQGETLMWVFWPQPTGQFTVGFYNPDRAWVEDSVWPTKDQAAARVNYLNGGGVSPSGVHRAARAGFRGSEGREAG